MKQESINQYLDSVQKKLAKRKVISKTVRNIQDYPVAKGQCIYIIDFKKKKLTYVKGITSLLGYTEDEFDIDLAVSIYHPDDYDIMSRLVKATLIYATESNVSADVSFFVAFRAKHKNGSYIKVLRQSNSFDIDKDGQLMSNLSMLSDISFLSTTNRVEWRFQAPGLDQKKFKEYVTKAYSTFFTERETEIIGYLSSGYTSEKIAEKLYISRHTVDTHRRKMLKKATCENTIDLLNFCKQNGLI